VNADEKLETVYPSGTATSVCLKNRTTISAIYEADNGLVVCVHYQQA